MKSLLLTLISLFTIALLFSLSSYRDWFLDKPLDYWNGFRAEAASHASPEDVRKVRYGQAYSICMKIKDAVEKRKSKDAVILLEPNSYYRDSLHSTLRMPEPAVFYYYTGLHSVWMNSPGVERSNYLVRIVKDKIMLDTITTPERLRLIRTRYQSFTPIL